MMCCSLPSGLTATIDPLVYWSVIRATYMRPSRWIAVPPGFPRAKLATVSNLPRESMRRSRRPLTSEKTSPPARSKLAPSRTVSDLVAVANELAIRLGSANSAQGMGDLLVLCSSGCQFQGRAVIAPSFLVLQPWISANNSKTVIFLRHVFPVGIFLFSFTAYLWAEEPAGLTVAPSAYRIPFGHTP